MSSRNLNDFNAFYESQLKKKLFEIYYNKEQPKCIKQVIDRFKIMVDYNVPHGKKLRGICAYESLLHLVGLDSNADQQHESSYLSARNYDKNQLIDEAKAVGWCIEFLQGSFLVADDIMDNSTYRRGQPCWYRKEDVGSLAINDSFYLISLVYQLINKFLNKHPMYSKFYELFNESFTNTVIGQGLDLITPFKVKDSGLFDFTNYDQDHYDQIVKWKTAFYSFCLPIQAALYLAFIDDLDVHEKCREILLEMGNYFQIQDDYLDCFGDPNVTGKVGTDIEESKCGWLIVQALKKCNSDQRIILEKNYGRSNSSNVASVKDVFDQLNIKKEFEQFETETFDKIMNKINCLDFPKSSIDQEQIERIKFILKLYASKIFKRKA